MQTEERFPSVAEQLMTRCKNLSSRGFECAKGVQIPAVFGGYDQTPCLSSEGCPACPMAEYPTHEEAEEHEQELEAFLGEFEVRREKARWAIMVDVHVHGKMKENTYGVVPCPICFEGELRYRRTADNGHIHARCATRGCISWKAAQTAP